MDRRFTKKDSLDLIERYLRSLAPSRRAAFEKMLDRKVKEPKRRNTFWDNRF